MVPRLCAFLASLILVLTFNAYACVLPLQTHAGMDCSSDTNDPARQICDAFLEIGPQSEYSPNDFGSLVHIAFHLPAQVHTIALTASLPLHPPPGPDTSIHSSISTTVLRI
jgi:hypothetical protein